ncbi:zinc finger MYM-type protein 1-like [Aphis craccivora]|uniref:Zinc finger MYM-type protein 1-like n=1 Tax=Aphis craccivora TaxID=307492 RepID=A0A6G0W315_APHCR|nr:zinc finger MYM-type protein 1-like [Aphis craccivora]
MFLCTPATNCSLEKSFSTLRRLKTYLKSVMNNDRLSALAVLNIESELTSSINYDNIIKEFAQSQSRKKN